MRVLIAIGCNQYEHASELTSAEKDAQRIFDALLRPDVGEYDVAASRLLLSPTLEQVRNCIRAVLFTESKIETFTFFFAGHGGVSSGSFYMWVRDSTPNAQSMSALSLADLFRSLNEAAPLQSNIIIDACESGGLITDLGILLKPELLGNSGTPAFTLVATSAQNQSALEDQEGGFGTNAILDCIEGRDFVNDSASVLDLVEIGRRVSARLNESGQDPIVWGLNLYGPPRFCRNPRYASDPSAPLRDLIQNWPVGSDQSIDQNYEALWAAYNLVDRAWNAESFTDVMRTVLDSCTSDPRALSYHAERLTTTFSLKAQHSTDPFRIPQLAACIVTCLLPHIGSGLVASSARRILSQSGVELLNANASLITSISINKYALLSSNGGGLADLYYLPIRVSKVLGWAAASTLICESPEQRLEARNQFLIILKLVLEHYSSSVIALSDSQAPFWGLTLSCASALGFREEAEQLAGLIFCTFIECKGRLAKSDLPPEKALDYLVARQSCDFSEGYDLVERPVETLTVLLKAAMSLGLEDVFDESLWVIDGLSFSAYLPSDYLQFGYSLMQNGQNLIWTIGQDIFRTRELTLNWPTSSPLPPNSFVAAIAVVASLLNPDRVPWFYFDESIIPKLWSELE